MSLPSQVYAWGMVPLWVKADEVSDRLMGFASFSPARPWATSASRHSVTMMNPIADRCMEHVPSLPAGFAVAIIDSVPQFLKAEVQNCVCLMQPRPESWRWRNECRYRWHAALAAVARPTQSDQPRMAICTAVSVFHLCPPTRFHRFAVLTMHLVYRIMFCASSRPKITEIGAAFRKLSIFRLSVKPDGTRIELYSLIKVVNVNVD